MSLTSLGFLAFLAITVIVYFLLPGKVQWIWLLIASTFFYLYYDIALAIWLYISIFSIYFIGLWMDKVSGKMQDRIGREDGESKKALKAELKKRLNGIKCVGVLFNAGIWIYFKFTNLFIFNLNNLFGADFRPLDILMPLGISFYTLSAISYVIDISRGKLKAQHNPLKLALWLSFFPNILQGPIVRYQDTAEQLYSEHRFDYQNFKFGAQLMLWGYFKKLVIADRAALPVSTIFNNYAQYEGLTFVFGIIMYAFQIYCDFSGGIDIITGASQMMGIKMPENFRRPYFSGSIAEYWRRWHITLGAWFRDYIFYPLSISKSAQKLGSKTRKMFGTKVGKLIPTCIAMIIVWTSNGIWHGAGFRYICYGFYQGALMVAGLLCGPFLKRTEERLSINTECFSWKLWRIVRTFALVCFGRILIKAPRFMVGLSIWKSIFTDFNPWVFTNGEMYTWGLNEHQMFILFCSILVLLFVDIIKERGVKLRETIQRQNVVFRWILYFAAISAVLLLGVYGYTYNAADFIYGNF